MTTFINVVHGIVNRRIWFNSAFAVITVSGYAAEVAMHAAGVRSFWVTGAFTLLHAVTVGTWLSLQPKRRTSRHRSVAA